MWPFELLRRPWLRYSTALLDKERWWSEILVGVAAWAAAYRRAEEVPGKPGNLVPRPALEPQAQVQLLPPTSQCCNGGNATSGGGRIKPGTRTKALTLMLRRLLCDGFWTGVQACWIVQWFTARAQKLGRWLPATT